KFPSDFPLNDPTEYNRMGELAFMQSRQRMALQFIREHPREYARLVAVRCVQYWTEPAGTLWPFISFLAWLGAVLFIRRKGWDALPYAAVMVCFPLVYYVTHTFPTYRHVIEPVLLLMAAFGAVSVAGTIVKRFRSGVAPRST